MFGGNSGSGNGYLKSFRKIHLFNVRFELSEDMDDVRPNLGDLLADITDQPSPSHTGLDHGGKHLLPSELGQIHLTGLCDLGGRIHEDQHGKDVKKFPGKIRKDDRLGALRLFYRIGQGDGLKIMEVKCLAGEAFDPYWCGCDATGHEPVDISDIKRLKPE